MKVLLPSPVVVSQRIPRHGFSRNEDPDLVVVTPPTWAKTALIEVISCKGGHLAALSSHFRADPYDFAHQQVEIRVAAAVVRVAHSDRFRP